MAEIEHADIDAQLEARRRAVAEADAALVKAIASRDEDNRAYDRQRALMKDGITTDAALTAAQAAAAVSPRVKVGGSRDRLVTRARAGHRRGAGEHERPGAFDGVVIKRAEVGETVSPFGVQGQSSREGGAIATIADLGELECRRKSARTASPN
jgi:hypothetical protein